MSAARDTRTPGNGPEGSQALSAPQPLRPEDVPAELLPVADRAAFMATALDQHVMRAVLAAVIPVIREQVAAEIEQAAEAEGDESLWDGGMYRAAEIARDGAAQQPPAPARQDDDEPLIDPDCRAGKCGSCVGGPCQHHCHQPDQPRDSTQDTTPEEHP